MEMRLEEVIDLKELARSRRKERRRKKRGGRRERRQVQTR